MFIIKGHISLGKKRYHIPRKGTVQTVCLTLNQFLLDGDLHKSILLLQTLFNPHGTVVKMFVIRYDLSDMPPNSKTFLRQRTLFMPSDANENDADNRKWLRYLIHLRYVMSVLMSVMASLFFQSIHYFWEQLWFINICESIEWVFQHLFRYLFINNWIPVIFWFEVILVFI